MNANLPEIGGAAENASTPLDLLRDATHDCHRQVEATIDWPWSLSSLSQYRVLLTRFLSVVRPAEQAIAVWLEKSPPPDYAAARRTDWLLHDLSALEVPAEVEPLPAEAFAFVSSRPAAIGAQYVLEGSSLGGQFLSRQIEQNLKIVPGEGGAYFAAYGSETMMRWKRFRQWANAELAAAVPRDPAALDNAIQAATGMFACFQVALGGARR